MMFSLHILECADGTLYIGHTYDLDERMRQHDAGKSDAYTGSRHPLKLLRVQEFETRYEDDGAQAERLEQSEEARRHRG